MGQIKFSDAIWIIKNDVKPSEVLNKVLRVFFMVEVQKVD